MTMYDHIRHSILMLTVNNKMMYVASTQICENISPINLRTNTFR